VAKSALGLKIAPGDLNSSSEAMAVVVTALFLLGLNLASRFEIGTSLGNTGASRRTEPRPCRFRKLPHLGLTDLRHQRT
jgi:hypothetical protein